MASEVISEFLIKLSTSMDEAEQNRLNDALKRSRLSAEAFGKQLAGVGDKLANIATIASGAGVAIAAAMSNIGRSFAGLGFSAERIGAPANKINALVFAMNQLGGSTQGTMSMLETLAQKQREMPGVLLSMFGVKEGTDPVEAIRQIGAHWATLMQQGQMGIAQMTKEASMIGVTQQDALRLASESLTKYYDNQTERQQKWNNDYKKLTDIGTGTARQLSRAQANFEGFTNYLEQTFGPSYNHSLDRMNGWFEANSGKITSHIDTLKSKFDGLTGGLSEMWQKLTPGEQAGVGIGGAAVGGLIGSRAIGGIVGMLSPTAGAAISKMGSLATFAVILAGVTNDYETWKRDRDQSFINWEKWQPGIDSALDKIGAFNKALSDLTGMPTGVISALEQLAVFLAGPRLIQAVLGGGLGKLLRVLALIPGSGVTAATLTALGVTGAVVAGMTVGQGHMATQEEENAQIARGTTGTLPLPHDKMTQAQASQRVAEDFQKWRGAQEGGWWNWAKGKVGMGLEPGKQHTADEIIQYMMAKGWTKEQSEGIAANAIAESGGRPRIINESGHAGLFQWDANRQQQFAGMFGHTMTDQSISDEQLFREELDFADAELHSTESIAGKHLAAATTAQGAAVAFGQDFERYASGPSPEDAHRADLAGQISRGGAPGAPPAPPAPPAPAAQQPLEMNPSGFSAPAGFTNPIDLGAAAGPVSNDNSRVVNITDASNITISGVSDPHRAADLVDRKRQQQVAVWSRHLGATYA